MNPAKLIFLLLTILVTGCFNNRSSWTAEQHKEFEAKCSGTDTFSNTIFLFKGFDNNEFDSVWVKEYNGDNLLDSFRFFVFPAENATDIERKERSATINRTMNTKYKYLFLVPQQKPYELTNMKMIKWAQYTMSGEGWGCVMGDYTLDGERFEDNANPTFIKRETKKTEQP